MALGAPPSSVQRTSGCTYTGANFTLTLTVSGRLGPGQHGSRPPCRLWPPARSAEAVWQVERAGPGSAGAAAWPLPVGDAAASPGTRPALACTRHLGRLGSGRGRRRRRPALRAGVLRKKVAPEPRLIGFGPWRATRRGPGESRAQRARSIDRRQVTMAAATERPTGTWVRPGVQARRAVRWGMIAICHLPVSVEK